MTNSYLLNMTDTNNITNNFIFLHFDLVISTAEGKKGKILVDVEEGQFNISQLLLMFSQASDIVTTHVVYCFARPKDKTFFSFQINWII